MGVRNYMTRDCVFPPDERFEITVKELLRSGSVVSFDCAILCNGCGLAQGIVNAYEPERTDEGNKSLGL